MGPRDGVLLENVKEDAWIQDKRELVNMLVFGEILLQIALKNVDGEKKGQTKRKGEEGENSFKSKQKL